METTNEAATYYEIIEQKEEFQKILDLLVSFDEIRGRFRSRREPELHYMRKAVAECNPAKLRVFARCIQDSFFAVVMEISTSGGVLATTYVHEDGIVAERVERASEPGHPVHSVLCFSDFCRNGIPRQPRAEWGDDRPSQAAIDLMNDESLWME